MLVPSLGFVDVVAAPPPGSVDVVPSGSVDVVAPPPEFVERRGTVVATIVTSITVRLQLDGLWV